MEKGQRPRPNEDKQDYILVVLGCTILSTLTFWALAVAKNSPYN
jgi:hypothetical protein